MKISFIIPVYNGSASIARCIQHILEQRGEFDREVIVVNDGSTDNTAEIVSAFPVNLYNRPHLGASATRNFGILMASGNYVALVDADTLLDLNWTQRCLAEDENTYDILQTNDLKYHEESPAARGLMQKMSEQPYLSHDNLLGFIGNGTFFHNRYKRFMVYDPMYIVGGEDIDLLFRLINQGIRIKCTLGPQFFHKHLHRAGHIKYLSFIKKKIVFAYGNMRTYFKHPYSDYARRDAKNNWWILPVYPFLWLYKKIITWKI